MHILGVHNLVNFGCLKVWAERGLIHIEDSRDNSYETISVREALVRIKSLNDMKMGLDGTESAAERAKVYAQREKIQSFVEQMITVCRLAQEQGSPDDLTARTSLDAKRPKTVLITEAPAFDY